MLIRRPGFGRFMGRFHLTLDIFVELISRAAFGAPFVVQTDVDDDAIKPGIETRPAVELFQVAKRFQERLLRQILGFLAVAGEAKGDMVSLLLMALDELFERPAISRLSSRD